MTAEGSWGQLPPVSPTPAVATRANRPPDLLGRNEPIATKSFMRHSVPPRYRVTRHDMNPNFTGWGIRNTR